MYELVLTSPIEELGKNGFRVRLPDFPRGDHPEAKRVSRLYLYEDGKLFGEPHVEGGKVMATGRGQYIHWEHTLLFSTNDNTNPNTNGRTYKVVWDDDVHYETRAKYFYGVLSDKIGYWRTSVGQLKGKRILEVGCGDLHGMCLVAAGFGANVVAADRYAPAWDDVNHPQFIDFLIRKGHELWPGYDASFLHEILEAKAFGTDAYRFFPIDAESLTSHVDVGFDYHCSHAALEHFYDLDKVAQMLWATAKSGSVGSHLVDFRDHKDFSTPLNFLLQSDEEYDLFSGDAKYTYGNRIRPYEFEALWKRNGFHDVEVTDCPSEIDEAYLSDFVPRLRASQTRFAQEPEDMLRRLSVNYVMRKP